VAWTDLNLGTNQQEMSRQTASILASHYAHAGADKPRLGQTGHATVFHEMLASNLPPEELTHKRMQHESESLIGAGLETTAWTLTLGSFYTLNDPQIHTRLRTELQTAIPDAEQIPSWATLETLPYLTAVVRESTFTLRLEFFYEPYAKKEEEKDTNTYPQNSPKNEHGRDRTPRPYQPKPFPALDLQ
jgi:cytochrome P450